MKIWIVEHGDYSDRHVVAVTDSEALADEIAGLGSGTATAYELNEIADRLAQGFRRWRVSFLVETGDCVQARLDYEEFDLSPAAPVRNRYPNEPSNWRELLECFVAARHHDEAVKIAADVRRMFLAREPVS